MLDKTNSSVDFIESILHYSDIIVCTAQITQAWWTFPWKRFTVCVCVCVLLLCIVLCYSVEMLAKSLMTECCLLLPWLSSIFMSWLTVVAISCCRAFLRKRLQLRNSRAAGWLSDAETNNTVTFSACNQWGMFWWCPCDVSVPSCPLRVTREA